MQRFQGIILRLGNQMFVRHYLWLNYPEAPQLMGLQFTKRESGRLSNELKELGFVRRDDAIWTIQRSEDSGS